uniref:Metalloendopeptidase n=1 Tax=Neogobius melanostomus TaxID=47308 RepID=A0A8C6U0V9_9GOBI
MNTRLLNMALLVSMLMLLAARQAQVTPVPESGEEQVPEETQTEDLSMRILTQNNNSAEFVLEGDLLFPKTRNAMMCWNNACHWPKGSDGKVSVAYTISSAFQSSERRLISTALSEIESETCIRFVPRSNENDYVSVENEEGCFSILGKQGGKQVLFLQRSGCIYKGIIQHEFLHALGFRHEHTRSDRDQYVRINWANVDPSKEFNFNKADTNNQGTPYDYDSIMHYGRAVFSKNGGDTVIPLSQAGVNIGLKQVLSCWDIQRVNMLYKCSIPTKTCN